MIDDVVGEENNISDILGADPSVVFQQMWLFSARDSLDSGPVMLGQSSALCKLDSSSVTQGQGNGCVCFGSPREKAMINTSWSVFRQRSENILAEVLEEFTDVNKQVPHAMTKINYNQLFTKFNEVFVTYYLW